MPAKDEERTVIRLRNDCSSDLPKKYIIAVLAAIMLLTVLQVHVGEGEARIDLASSAGQALLTIAVVGIYVLIAALSSWKSTSREPRYLLFVGTVLVSAPVLVFVFIALGGHFATAGWAAAILACYAIGCIQKDWGLAKSLLVFLLLLGTIFVTALVSRGVGAGGPPSREVKLAAGAFDRPPEAQQPPLVKLNPDDIAKANQKPLTGQGLSEKDTTRILEAPIGYDAGLKHEKQTGEDSAISDLRSAIRRDPRSVEALNRLGVLLTDKGDVDEAISAFKKALGLSPGDPALHRNLAMALKKKGSLDQANQEFTKAGQLSSR